MGILLKGIEMPISCFGCPCYHAEFMKCSAKEHLSLPRGEYGEVLGEIPDWCPLVEAQPNEEITQEQVEAYCRSRNFVLITRDFFRQLMDAFIESEE